MLDNNLEQIKKDLPPHVQRMISEYTELHERCMKLEAFVRTENETYMGLLPVDRDLLHKQLTHMTDYKNTLSHRIERALGGK